MCKYLIQRLLSYRHGEKNGDWWVSSVKYVNSQYNFVEAHCLLRLLPAVFNSLNVFLALVGFGFLQKMCSSPLLTVCYNKSFCWNCGACLPHLFHRAALKRCGDSHIGQQMSLWRLFQIVSKARYIFLRKRFKLVILLIIFITSQVSKK